MLNGVRRPKGKGQLSTSCRETVVNRSTVPVLQVMPWSPPGLLTPPLTPSANPSGVRTFCSPSSRRDPPLTTTTATDTEPLLPSSRPTNTLAAAAGPDRPVAPAPLKAAVGPSSSSSHSSPSSSTPHPSAPSPSPPGLLALAAAVTLTSAALGPQDLAFASTSTPTPTTNPATLQAGPHASSSSSSSPFPFPSLASSPAAPRTAPATIPIVLTAPPPAASSAAPSGPSAPPVRFTSPDLADQLPPLPTQFPPLPELQLPNYTTAKLRNGLRVFLLRDDEVPLVRATLLMRGGQYGSPPDKVGLATLTAYVQRAGGSTGHPAPSLDTRLEQLAASIELGAGPQALSADLQCLAEDTEEVMGLMAEVVRSAAFPAEKLSLYQAQVYNALDHQNDSPSAVARRKISKLMYGPDSIYARTPTKASIAAITPNDLRAYAAAWERPDAAVLGVVGSFEPRQMLALLEREFGDWAPAAGQPAQPPPVPRGAPPALPPGVEAAAAPPAGAAAGDGGAAAGGGGSRRPVVYLVDRPGLTQAVVLVAEPGISLSSPEVFALDTLSGLFNSFGGQLFDTLRSREGLAYSVSGAWDSPADHQGLFVAGGQTSSPGEFLRSLRQLLARSASEPPSPAEVEAAKSETLNSFAFNFASAASQLQRILVYDLLGLPQNFLFQYVQGIERVDAEAVRQAAAAHLHPGRQAAVVVADREVAGPSLEGAGFEVRAMRLDDGPTPV